MQQFERWSLDALEGGWCCAYGDALACDKWKRELEEGREGCGSRRDVDVGVARKGEEPPALTIS